MLWRLCLDFFNRNYFKNNANKLGNVSKVGLWSTVDWGVGGWSARPERVDWVFESMISMIKNGPWCNLMHSLVGSTKGGCSLSVRRGHPLSGRIPLYPPWWNYPRLWPQHTLWCAAQSAPQIIIYNLAAGSRFCIVLFCMRLSYILWLFVHK